MNKLGRINTNYIPSYGMPSGMNFDVSNPLNRGKLTRMNINRQKDDLINLEKASYKKLSDIIEF